MAVYEIEFKHICLSTHLIRLWVVITVTLTKGCRKVETKNNIKYV